jgi:hypothetical protein
VAEVKETVTVRVRLGDVEVGADQGYQQRIKNVVHKLEIDFFPLLRVRMSHLCRSTGLGGDQPLKSLQL